MFLEQRGRALWSPIYERITTSNTGGYLFFACFTPDWTVIPRRTIIAAAPE